MEQAVAVRGVDQPRPRSTQRRLAIVLGTLAVAAAIIITLVVSISAPAPASRPVTDTHMSALQALHADANAPQFSEAQKLQALQRLKAGK